jgi:hypothetical protein
MTLMMTSTTPWTAVATLLFLGGYLSVPAAWAQSPSMPASGAKGAGPASAPASPAPRPPAPAAAGALSATREGTGNTPWPREATEGGRAFTVYQPQIEKWDGVRLHARAAVSVESAASPLQHFGVVWFSARTRSTGSSPSPTSGSTRSRSRRSPIGPPTTRRCSSSVCPERCRGSRSTGSRRRSPSPKPSAAGGHGPAGQERPAARHLQHDAGPSGPRGREARPPSGRRPEHEPSSGRQLVGAHPGRPEGRQTLPAGGGTVVRGRHPRRAVGRGRAPERRARRRHAERGETYTVWGGRPPALSPQAEGRPISSRVAGVPK